MAELEIVDKKIKYSVIIIPVSGCDNCIDRTLEAVLSIGSRDSLHFILTGRSRKEINLRIKDIQLSSGVYRDTLGLAYSKNLCSNYPVAFIISENRIVNSVEINGQNADSLVEALLNKFH